MDRHSVKPSRKGSGFEQPVQPHEHWHIDISYLNIAGRFYYMCSILDGCSRYVTHWEIREQMTEDDVTTILQRAREKFPDARPRIISDNGPQFIAKDFKEFIRVRTPLALEEARRLGHEYVERYNQVRLHSSIGYVSPQDRLLGRQQAIFDERDRKLAEAREHRRAKRQAGQAQEVA